MKRLLLVDDDPDILDALAMVLGDSYEVTLAKHGREALNLIEHEPFDAMVLDLMMPVMDGSTLVREMQKRGMFLPVILASASGDLSEQARDLHVADYLPKPFRIEHLEAKIARLVEAETNGTTGDARSH